MRKVTFTRRLVQLTCFILLMYAGFFWDNPLESILPPIPSGAPRTTQYERNRILWVSGKESVIELYVPALACRFTPRGGLFKSCSVHLLSENFTWQTSARILLPHVLFVVLCCLLLGRFWCGWICPMGVIMDVLTWLRRACGRPPKQLRPETDRFLFYTRHVLLWGSLLLAVLISFPWLGQGANDALFLFYCQLCPARLIYPPFGGVNPCWSDWTNSLTSFLTIVGWAIFALFFLSFKVPRFWCRICAIGAFTGYFNRGALLTLEKAPGKCTSCATCRRSCPVDVELVYRDDEGPVVTAPECQLCLSCLEDCPEPGCLELKFLGRRVLKS